MDEIMHGILVGHIFDSQSLFDNESVVYIPANNL